MDRDVMRREAFGFGDACFRFAIKPVKLSDEPYLAVVQVHQKVRCFLILGMVEPACGEAATRRKSYMLLFRQKPPADWLPKVLANIPAVLIDHAHLERKAATSALNLEKYRDLYPHVDQLNAIAIEELQHFQLVLALLKRRGIPFGQPYPSPWIAGLMKSIRNGPRAQVIDHLIWC